MAIVKMKKLKLMVASSEREKLLRELMLLGCVEVSQPPHEEEEQNLLLSRVDVPDLVKLRTEQNLLGNSITALIPTISVVRSTSLYASRTRFILPAP